MHSEYSATSTMSTASSTDRGRCSTDVRNWSLCQMVPPLTLLVWLNSGVLNSYLATKLTWPQSDLEQLGLFKSNPYDHETAHIEVCVGVGQVRATNSQELHPFHTWKSASCDQREGILSFLIKWISWGFDFSWREPTLDTVTVVHPLPSKLNKRNVVYFTANESCGKK